MGFTKATVFFTLAFIATLLLLSSATAKAESSAVNPFCVTAQDKALCTKLAKGGKTWPRAMTNAINAAIKIAKTGKPIADGVAAKLPNNLFPQSKASIIDSCNGAYERIFFNLDQCLGFVKDDPTLAFKTYLSSISFWDCKFALEEFEVSLPEVVEFDAQMMELARAMLAILEKKPKKDD